MILNKEHEYLVNQDGNYFYEGTYEIGEKMLNGDIKNSKRTYFKVRHKYCNKLSDVRIDVWKSGMRPHNRRKNKCCCGCYENSIAYHIECELGLNLYDVWNFEKNNKLGLDPYKISKGSTTKVWLLCLKHDYHNYDRYGNKVGYEIDCHHFYYKNRCSYCAKKKIHWMDSLAYNYPKVAEMIAISENNLTFDDCYNISCKSGRYFYKCLDCNNISKNKAYLLNLTRGEYACAFCSDNISVPEKFFANILLQLKNQNQIDNFKNHIRSNTFKWLRDYEYDFYAIKDDITYIFETHGMQHYEDRDSSKWVSLDVQQYNDEIKKRKAKFYGIDNYIVIDCRCSTFEWLNKNVEKELSPYFNLININWELAWKESQSNKCIEVWRLWNKNIRDYDKISKILNINVSAVKTYLKKGCAINYLSI